MPTLVAEMTPLQRVWLYENQLTRGDSYEEKWNRMPMKSSFDEIFRARPDMAPRKRKMETVVTANPTPTHRRHQEHHKGPMFMHHGDKLTWQQSLENLTIYRDHYGNCNVPQKYALNPKLGRWVNKQRKKKKNPGKYGALTDTQVYQLEDLGFAWNQT